MPGIRISTGIEGFDRVLGTNWRTKKSGINVPSTVLLAGAAGVGKSTLLMRVASSLETRKFLYLSTEQTLEEIRDNAERCGLTIKDMKRIEAHRISTLEEALKLMRKRDPRVVVLDSLNELVDPRRDTGDVHANLIRTTNSLKLEAEKRNRAIILITHMNKKEEIAGVQRIQHIVSAVMRFEKRGKLRVVHCPDKNRFGSTSEKAYFKMTERGMEDAVNVAEEEKRDAKLERRRFGSKFRDKPTDLPDE